MAFAMQPELAFVGQILQTLQVASSGSTLAAGFGLPYAVNDDPRQYTVKLSPDAEVWLPNMRSVLYSLYRCEPDAAEISIAIEQY